MPRSKDVMIMSGSAVYRLSKAKYVAFLENRASGGTDPLDMFGAKFVLAIDTNLPMTEVDATRMLNAVRGTAATSVAA